MSSLFSPINLQERNKIIQSQILLENFLEVDIINKLVHLFDDTHDNYLDKRYKITSYIEEERKLQGLNDSNVEIVSYVYDYNRKNSTLYLGIKKNSQDFIHLTIHLIPSALDPNHSGIIHIFKDIYKNKTTRRTRPLIYSLISVEKLTSKPNSLKFSIDYGYNTPGISNSHMYDPEIQEEMDVIINVLNRLFDEDDEYYIGNNSILYPIHKKTNLVLNNINKHTTIITRKNKGTFLYPTSISTESPININYTTHHKIHRKRNRLHKTYYKSTNKKRGITRKVRK
jgi:hypothetical protein